MVKGPTPYLLVVEDSDEDFESLRRILVKTHHAQTSVIRCYDGDEAIDFLQSEGDYANQNLESFPSLVLLDLNLPGTDGREVLNHIKQDDVLKIIPVVVLTTSSNPKDVEACYRYGANSYLLKQMSLESLKESVSVLLDYWLKVTVLPDTLIT